MTGSALTGETSPEITSGSTDIAAMTLSSGAFWFEEMSLDNASAWPILLPGWYFIEKL